MRGSALRHVEGRKKVNGRAQISDRDVKEQESCAIANMTARCSDKSKQTG